MRTARRALAAPSPPIPQGTPRSLPLHPADHVRNWISTPPWRPSRDRYSIARRAVRASVHLAANAAQTRLGLLERLRLRRGDRDAAPTALHLDGADTAIRRLDQVLAKVVQEEEVLRDQVDTHTATFDSARAQYFTLWSMQANAAVAGLWRHMEATLVLAE